MSCIAIDSIDDPRLAAYRHLKRTNATRRSGQFVAEGEKLVRRLLASDHRVTSLLLGQKYVSEFEPLAPAGTAVYCVPDAMIERIIGFNFHRGVLACGMRPAARSLDEVLGRREGKTTVVVCPEIHDPENLGSVLRTSLALGVATVLLGPHAGDPYSRRVLRTSMGAPFQLPVSRLQDVNASLVELRERLEFELVATVTDRDAEPLSHFLPAQRTAVLFGSEGHGLPAEIVRLCDRRVTIPMTGKTDSLNVGIAAGIVLYQLGCRPETAGRGAG
jgi:tRNA G18 (ribose-2'-O)-methylase SpoU